MFPMWLTGISMSCAWRFAEQSKMAKLRWGRNRRVKAAMLRIRAFIMPGLVAFGFAFWGLAHNIAR